MYYGTRAPLLVHRKFIRCNSVVSEATSRKRAQVTAHRGEQFRSDVVVTHDATVPSVRLFFHPRRKSRAAKTRVSSIARSINPLPVAFPPFSNRGRKRGATRRVPPRQRGFAIFVDAPIPCSLTFRRRRVSGASLPGLLKFVNMKSRRPLAASGGA